MERELRASELHRVAHSAEARGWTGGRPKIDPEKLKNARILYENLNP